MIKLTMFLVSLAILIAGWGCAFFLLRKSPKGMVFTKFRIYVYLPVAIWSLLYYIVCVIYAGFRLSMVWMWPALAAFSILRIWMLKGDADGKPRFSLPKAVKIVYQSIFALALIFFLYIEHFVVDGMAAEPPAGLDYVIVLGAGLNGREPSNPLRVRIKCGADYLEENADTVLIASGGQGRDEVISEAECIREKLIGVYGVSEERILLEDRSTDTEENLKYSMKIIGDSNASVGIITNGFHEYRAMMIAKHAGYENVHSVPATTLLPVGIHYIVREFFGVLEIMLKYGLN